MAKRQIDKLLTFYMHPLGKGSSKILYVYIILLSLLNLYFYRYHINKRHYYSIINIMYFTWYLDLDIIIDLSLSR